MKWQIKYHTSDNNGKVSLYESIVDYDGLRALFEKLIDLKGQIYYVEEIYLESDHE